MAGPSSWSTRSISSSPSEDDLLRLLHPLALRRLREVHGHLATAAAVLVPVVLAVVPVVVPIVVIPVVVPAAPVVPIVVPVPIAVVPVVVPRAGVAIHPHGCTASVVALLSLAALARVEGRGRGRRRLVADDGDGGAAPVERHVGPATHAGVEWLGAAGRA